MNIAIAPRTILLALFVASAGPTLRAATAAQADVAVRHFFEVRGLDGAPEGTRFLLFPTTMMGGAVEVAEGERFTFSEYAAPMLFAVEGEVPPLAELTEEFFTEPPRPRSEMVFNMITSLPESTEAREIRTTFKLEGIEGESIVLTKVEDVFLDADGRIVGAGEPEGSRTLPVILGIVVAAVVALLFGLSRLRRG